MIGRIILQLAMLRSCLSLHLAVPPDLASYPMTTVASSTKIHSIMSQQTEQRTYKYPLDGASLIWSLLHLAIATENINLNDYDQQWTDQKFQRDQVVRIVDANTIRLKKNGLVTLAAIRTPSAGSNFQFPECFTYNPTYKIQNLLPNDTKVFVKIVSSNSKSTSNSKMPPPAVLVRSADQLVVNEELVRTGFARVRGKNSIPELLPYKELLALQDQAQTKGLGLFQRCEELDDVLVAEFEPLELTLQTQWGEDGGRPILQRREVIAQTPPPNPGDIKGCSDFETYEDALGWFERYRPWYGDVAKLDRNGDGIPCPGLPHTTVQQKYRMKIPSPDPFP